MRRAIVILGLVLVFSFVGVPGIPPPEQPDPVQLQHCLSVEGSTSAAVDHCGRLAWATERIAANWQRALDAGHVFLTRCRGGGWKLTRIAGGPVQAGLGSNDAFVQVSVIWKHFSNALATGADGPPDPNDPKIQHVCFSSPEKAARSNGAQDFAFELFAPQITFLSGFPSGGSISFKQGALLLYDIGAGRISLQDPEQLLHPPFWAPEEAGSAFDRDILDGLRWLPLVHL